MSRVFTAVTVVHGSINLNHLEVEYFRINKKVLTHRPFLLSVYAVSIFYS